MAFVLVCCIDSTMCFIYISNVFLVFHSEHYMKKIIFSLVAVATLSVIPSISQAETRFLIETSNGQKSCLWQNGGYTDCVSPEVVRYDVDTPDGVMKCLWQNNSYVDCIPSAAYNDEASGLSTEADSAAVENESTTIAADEVTDIVENGAVSVENMSEENSASSDVDNINVGTQSEFEQYIYDNNQYEQNNIQGNEYEEQSYDGQYEQYEEQSYDGHYEDQYHYEEAEQYEYSYYNTGLDSGLTYGVGLGWFGHVYDGDDWLDAFALSVDAGYKWKYVGLELDFDISFGGEDKADSFLFTYSFTPMVAAYIPFGVICLHTIGFGVGWSGWSRDHDYFTIDSIEDIDKKSHIDKTFYSGANRGSNMSLKLYYRFDIDVDHFFFGLELSWIPYIETGENSDIVNNLIGLSLRIGGLD